MHRSSTTALLGLMPLFLLLLAGCAGEREEQAAAVYEMPVLRTKADTVAMHAYEALGGPAAWAALPYLRFDFGSERDGVAQTGRKHLWNRQTGDYRLEWTSGEDSAFVALFNVNTQEGQVYLNGTPLEAAQNAERLQQAYRSFINDTYWLLAPVKMLDPGVERTYAADSSDAEHDVVLLTFQEVGLTPGDRYWMWVNKETGRVDYWKYNLESGREGDLQRWTAYEELQTPAGPVYVATRKETMGQPFAMLTGNVEAPAEVPEEMFTDPNPRL